MKPGHDPIDALLDEDVDERVAPEHERRIREGLGALLGPLATGSGGEASPADAPAGAPAPGPTATSALAKGALGKYVTVALVATVAAGGGFVVGRTTAPAPVASVPTGDANRAVPSSVREATPTAEPSSSASSPVVVPSASATSSSLRALPSTATGAPRSSADGFDREQSLLERARAAIARHDAAAAEQALDECDREFQRSRHAEERDYLRILVVRERGDGDRTRELARAFLARYPESMLRGRVEPLSR